MSNQFRNMSGSVDGSGQLLPVHESDDEELDEEPDVPSIPFTLDTPPAATPARKRRGGSFPFRKNQSEIPLPPSPRRHVSDPTDSRTRKRGFSQYIASFRRKGSGMSSREYTSAEGRGNFRRRQPHSSSLSWRTTVDSSLTHATYVRYRVGDPVLVQFEPSEWVNPVNRYGYPPGKGMTPEEQRGPYLYILATVKKVHFEEDAEYYTVTRADTDTDERANTEWMVPIRTPRGEAAALHAATEMSKAEQSDKDRDEEEFTDQTHAILSAVLFPFLWIYDVVLYDYVWRPISRTGKAVVATIQRQAKLCLHGVPPYALSFRLTMVNFLVICSIWYMFIDQIRLAFFAPSSDYALAIVSFIIWLVLVLELISEVFIRPEGYGSLIMSDKAYTPRTARYINAFHLFFETISLVAFIPEFLCVFPGSSYTCGARPPFSFFNGAFLAVLGPTRPKSFFGRAFMALVRLRVFGLVRHWKNMWLNNTFVTMKWKSSPNSAKEMVMRHISITRQRSVPQSIAEEQQEKDWSLVHASNIGTALMVTNSHRALLLMWFIVGVFPCLLSVIIKDINKVASSMVAQLGELNVLLTNATDINECEFLRDSVGAWLIGATSGNKAGFGSDGLDDVFVVYLEISPARCNLTGAVTRDICDEYADATEDTTTEDLLNLVQGVCSVWSSTYLGVSDQELADLVGTRVGAIYTVGANPILGNLTTFNATDGSVITETVEFSVVAKFNQSLVIRPAAALSFFLQICLFVCVLGGLSILRRDAATLVISPLRRMLKIVARYAKNPLAPTNTSALDDDDTDDDSIDVGDPEISQLGNFETEQLITAITKIADLLRKCWGVAGADIISTNLDTKEGTLTEVFNPTVPGKSVYALFGFAAIQGFDHILRGLGDEVMILINDVAAVLHNEVFRWGFGDSGQCNKNLGNAFLMVYRIGLVKEVIQKLEQATDVVFSNPAKKSSGMISSSTAARQRRAEQTNKRQQPSENKQSRLQIARTAAAERRHRKAQGRRRHHDAMSLSLQSLPGISAFTDRAVIGMLKSFAGIYRDNKLKIWERDFRLGAGVGAFSINLIFGMDAGWAQEGAVGSSFKIDATYLSPHVNMASRMMSACKQYGVSILLSQAVQELMSDTARTKLRHLDTVTVKGSTLKQKIYTYDARHKGVDFFLFARSEEQADIDSERYSSATWNNDQDLRAMREHVTEEFESEFNRGRDAYLAGDWETAVIHLERADEIMVENVREMGYLDADLDSQDGGVHDGDVGADEVDRHEMEDGPCRCLLNFIAKEGGKAPATWKGYRPLLNK